MSRYVKPNNSYQRLSTFTCPHCGVLCSHEMVAGNRIPPLESGGAGADESLTGGLYLLDCVVCGGHTIFFKRQVVYPANRIGPAPIDGMPEEIRTEYEESRRIAEASPRAAAALLRLAVQKLCKLLGEKGENLNQDIANLVKKGLNVEVQRALVSPA